MCAMILRPLENGRVLPTAVPPGALILPPVLRLLIGLVTVSRSLALLSRVLILKVRQPSTSAMNDRKHENSKQNLYNRRQNEKRT